MVDAIQVRIRAAEHLIYFGSNLGAWLDTVLPDRNAIPFALLLVDENVHLAHGERLLEAFRKIDLEVRVIPVPAGETTKSLDVYGRLCGQVLGCGPDRTTPLVACGGGVTGDVAGFVAATVLRGLPLYHVPTTTLSQADSGVGGKVGLNHRAGKNLLGTFYQPRSVFIDPTFNRTLADRDYLSGLFEAVKMGLILDHGLHAFLMQRWDRLVARKETDLAHVLHQSCRLKARVVELDELEQGPRRVLNFGHTVGHVLEHLDPGGLRHGEAVAWGMAAAVHLSMERAGLDRAQGLSIKGFIYGCPAIRRPELPEQNEFLRLLEMDKKRRGRSLDVVLLRSVGQTVINRDIEPADLWRAARDILLESRSER
jgi:3-dehydroquinate synthase